MTELWAAIDIRRPNPRILVTEGSGQPLVKARMTAAPHHPRALITLLESLSMWEGRHLRAALVVGDQAGCAVSRYHDFFAELDRTPMYSIEYVTSPCARPRDCITGMGRFGDLKQLLDSEVAR